MSDFIIKKPPFDLPSNASLALVGQYFNRMGISQRISHKFPISGCVEQAGGLGRRLHEILRK
jgi:hypothetical protein